MKIQTVLLLLAVYIALVTARTPYSGRGLVWDWGGIDFAYSPAVFVCNAGSVPILSALSADC